MSHRRHNTTRYFILTKLDESKVKFRMNFDKVGQCKTRTEGDLSVRLRRGPLRT